MLLTFVCALVIPFIVSIYRSSVDYGMKQFINFTTKGAEFHVRNAKEEQLKYFKEIEGVEAHFDEGIIYIKIIKDGQFAHGDGSEESLLERSNDLAAKIMAAKDKANDSGLEVYSYRSFGKDKSLGMLFSRLSKIYMSMTIVSALIAFSSYKSHLNLFKSEVGIMRSLGAKNKQIVNLFIIEFLFELIFAGVIAFLISSGFMYFISKCFFAKNIENFVWVEFKINIQYILFPVAVFVLVGIITILVHVNLLSKAGVKENMTNSYGKAAIRHYRRIKTNKSPKNLLAALFLRRTNVVPFISAFIAIPIIVLIIVSLNYLLPSVNAKPPKTSISIQTYIFNKKTPVLSAEDIDYIKKMEEVDSIKTNKLVFPSDYLVKDNRMKGEFKAKYLPDEENAYCDTQIFRYSEVFPNSKLKLKSNEVAVSKNHKYLIYKAGDSIVLQPGGFNYKTMEFNFVDPYELKIVELVDDVQLERMLKLYLNDELCDEIEKDKEIADVDIRLKKPAEHKLFLKKLLDKFPGIKKNMTNHQEIFELSRQQSLGEIIMYSSLFGIMLIFLIAILGIRIYGHMNEQRGIAGMLSMIGADRQSIFKGYLRQMRINFAAVVLTAFVLAYALLAILLHRTGIHVKLDLMSISIQAGILLSIYLAYCLPVHWVFGGNRHEKL